MKIAELFAEIGFKFDTIKLHEVAKSISDLNLYSVVSTAAVVTLGETIKDLIEDSTHASTALTILSNATGLDPEYIQRFEKFSHALGSTKEEADSFLNTIGKLQLAISQGRGDATPFVMLGINPLGKSKEELASLINQRLSDENFLKQWAGKFAKDAKSMDQIRAELKRQIGGGLGLSDSMLRVMSSKDFSKEMAASTSSFVVKTREEIENAIAAQREFVTVTENLNTEFQRTADVLLPNITAALNAFRTNGGLKFLTDSLATIGRAFEILGIGAQYAKAGLMNLDSAKTMGLVNASRFGHEVRKAYHINVDFSGTVHAADSTDFVHKFDIEMRKKLLNSELQFGQQT